MIFIEKNITDFISKHYSTDYDDGDVKRGMIKRRVDR